MVWVLFRAGPVHAMFQQQQHEVSVALEVEFGATVEQHRWQLQRAMAAAAVAAALVVVVVVVVAVVPVVVLSCLSCAFSLFSTSWLQTSFRI